MVVRRLVFGRVSLRFEAQAPEVLHDNGRAGAVGAHRPPYTARKRILRAYAGGG